MTKSICPRSHLLRERADLQDRGRLGSAAIIHGQANRETCRAMFSARELCCLEPGRTICAPLAGISETQSPTQNGNRRTRSTMATTAMLLGSTRIPCLGCSR